ncbi:MAG: HPF/RaiA family ribosome-associated protein [Candidatus Latescibacterota bacterium]
MARAYDFPVTFTCRHDNCDEVFKQTAIEQVLKLSRYYGHIIDADITINGKQPSTRVEVVIRVPGMVITAAHDDFHRTVALDAAVEKAKIQIKRLKEKVVDHRASFPGEPVEDETESDE